MELTINDYPLFYILWNTVLGITPFFLCYLMFVLSRQKSRIVIFVQVLLFLLWLLFLPNSAYIISGVRHLNGFCPDTLLDTCMSGVWMIIIFFIYALWGLILYFYTLEQMVLFTRRQVSRVIAFYFPFLVLPVVALGFLLGLVNRFNTWELLFNARYIISSSLEYFTTIEGVRNWLVYTFGLIGLYYVGKYLFIPLEKIKILNKISK